MNAPSQPAGLAGPSVLAAAQRSQEVTDWAARAGWVVGLLLFITLLYWLMRQGWKWRGTLQCDLPELQATPEDPGEARLTLAGRYHGSTTAGHWLDRIVAHGLGTRSRAALTLTDQGVDVVRPGARDFFIPGRQLRGARLEKGIAGKVLTEGGLLVITWEHGDRSLDSGFRADHAADHLAWVERINSLTGDGAHDGDSAYDGEGAHDGDRNDSTERAAAGPYHPAVTPERDT